MSFEQIKDDLIRALLWALLISSLVATITNLAWAFSVVSPLGSKAAWFGAISFDGTVLIISFYARRFPAGSYARHLTRAIVITNTIISIYANVYRAIEFQQQLQRISGAAWLSMPIVLGLALPLLTLALAEVLVLDEVQRSHDYAREQKKVARREAKLLPEPSQLPPESRQLERQDKVGQVLEIVARGPVRNRQIVTETGFGRSSVSAYLAELVAEGQIFRRGQLYQLAESGQEVGGGLAESGGRDGVQETSYV